MDYVLHVLLTRTQELEHVIVSIVKMDTKPTQIKTGVKYVP